MCIALKGGRSIGKWGSRKKGGREGWWSGQVRGQGRVKTRGVMREAMGVKHSNEQGRQGLTAQRAQK